ncbi:MAG TPA: flavodoxin domain-containing protein [Candidatus Limnocylindria bacterium]
MHSLVIYASTSGNTQTVAEAVAEALRTRGTASVLHVTEAQATTVPKADLTVIGAPTEGHTMTKPMAAWFDQLSAGSLAGRRFAAFDTRLRWPRFLSGSAAEEIVKRIERLDGHLVAPPASFMVTMKPELEPGELERASAWAADLADAMAAVGAAGPA